MGAINSFEDILSWQKAGELNKEIYQITQLDSFKNNFDFKRQIIFHDLTNKTLELSKLLAAFIKYLKK